MNNDADTTGLARAPYDSPLGELEIQASTTGLVALLWPRGEYGEADLEGVPGSADSTAIIDRTRRQLDEYFAGGREEFDLPLDLRGTDFQVMVWRSLASIPYGETVSYAKQAANLGRPDAVRAIAAANGRNPVSIILPCHRVIGSDGSLTGYAGGLETKRWLLAHEGVLLDV